MREAIPREEDMSNIAHHTSRSMSRRTALRTARAGAVLLLIGVAACWQTYRPLPTSAIPTTSATTTATKAIPFMPDVELALTTTQRTRANGEASQLALACIKSRSVGCLAEG